MSDLTKILLNNKSITTGWRNYDYKIMQISDSHFISLTYSYLLTSINYGFNYRFSDDRLILKSKDYYTIFKNKNNNDYMDYAEHKLFANHIHSANDVITLFDLNFFLIHKIKYDISLYVNIIRMIRKTIEYYETYGMHPYDKSPPPKNIPKSSELYTEYEFCQEYLVPTEQLHRKISTLTDKQNRGNKNRLSKKTERDIEDVFISKYDRNVKGRTTPHEF